MLYNKIKTCATHNIIYICMVFSISIVTVQAENNCKNVSQSGGKCLDIALNVTNGLNSSAGACNDFYAYVCDKWIQDHPIPPGKWKIDQFDVWQNQVDKQIQEILEGDSAIDDIEPIISARKVYRMCTNTDELDRAGISKFHEILNNIAFSGWPLVSRPDLSVSIDKIMTWQKISRNIDRYYMSGGIYSLSLIHQRSNPRNTIIALTEPPMTPFLKPLVYRQSNFNATVKKYRSFIKNVGLTLGILGSWYQWSGFRATLEEDLDDLMNFTVQLAGIMTGQKNPSTYSTISSFQNEYNSDVSEDKPEQVDWWRTISNVYQTRAHKIHNWTDIAYDSAYFSNLQKLLANTTERTVKNYVYWTFILQLLPYGPKELRYLEDEIFNVEGKPRSLRCVKIPNLEHAVYHEYMKRFFPNSSQIAVRQYVQDLKNVFISQISESFIIDTAAKNFLIDKMNSTKIEVGGPEWYSDASIKLYYRGLNIKKDHLLETILDINTFAGRNRMYKVERDIKPTDVKSKFDCLLNTAFLPAGLLHFLYREDNPKVVNDALLGAVIGPLLAHTYDTKCKSMKNENKYYWSLMSESAYHSKKECYRNQYALHTVPETAPFHSTVRINSSATRDINIADSGSYTAYQTYLKNRDYTSVLPNYSNEQLYFMIAASVHCENFVVTDSEFAPSFYPRATGRSRVDGSFANIPEFGEIFNCPLNSAMHPKDKCMMWTFYLDNQEDMFWNVCPDIR